MTFADDTPLAVPAPDVTRMADELGDLFDNAPCGYHSLDATALIVRINDTQLRWLAKRDTP